MATTATTTPAPVAIPPTPATTPRRTRTAPATGCVTYRRDAEVPGGKDKIVNSAWYRFLKIMLGVGGVAVLILIVFVTAWIVNRDSKVVSSTSSATPLSSSHSTPATALAPVPASTVTAPVVATPTPPIKVEVVVNPIKVTVVTPSAPTRHLSDAERRNEALKERLRRRYKIE
ncbi:MAG: hypothetical protein A3C61_01330 [Candidatus Yanofskybacteria bacterium RIFCSPHIGHO2_02_FULL_39_10]|uniref:Uncharacterized protein n=1 Tax=Candidatus Yanofskybacteria bacterium RIFCSPHIGHO2_02_FULL_39_10 TaxID=1802674 RepID=A0A1F8F8Q3_9BACT|nr:MAG: hypothetical protein A3C61_01330 [Candidatus Yanofskybacteria bacterium RIFCSPHIGHO2_02_FULL_39_10]